MKLRTTLAAALLALAPAAALASPTPALIFLNDDGSLCVQARSTYSGGTVVTGGCTAISTSASGTGAQGPKGDTGATGATGATGPQGNPTTVNGKTGASITITANDVGAVPTTGGTMSNTLVIDANGAPEVFANDVVGHYKYFSTGTSGLTRWAFGSDNQTEGSGNSGSDFFFYRYDNAGNYLSPVITMARSSGIVTIPQLQTTTMPITDNSVSAATTQWVRNRPSFQADNAGNGQTAPATTNQVLTFSGAPINTGGFFGNNQWTPPAGNYHVTAHVVFTGVADQATYICAIWKNGAVAAQHPFGASGTGAQACEVSLNVGMSGTDYVQAVVYNTTGTNVGVSGNTFETFFSGEAL